MLWVAAPVRNRPRKSRRSEDVDRAIEVCRQLAPELLPGQLLRSFVAVYHRPGASMTEIATGAPLTNCSKPRPASPRNPTRTSPAPHQEDQTERAHTRVSHSLQASRATTPRDQERALGYQRFTVARSSSKRSSLWSAAAAPRCSARLRLRAAASRAGVPSC